MMARMTPVSLHFSDVPTGWKKKLYRQTTVGYWFCMFVTNSLSRRTLLQINLRQLHSVPCATRYASLPAPTSCFQAKVGTMMLQMWHVCRFYYCSNPATAVDKNFYTQTVLHTDASTRRRFYTQMRFTHAHTLSHTNAFTHRRVYTQTLLPVDAFTRILHAEAFYTRTHAFTHKRFYTQTLLHTDAFTHRRFYTQKLLHKKAFTHRRFYTQTLLHADAFTRRCGLHTHTRFHTNAFTHRRVYTQTLLHADAFYTRRHTFTHKRFYTQTPLNTDTFTQTKASIAIFPPFLTSKVHVVRKGYDWPSKIAIFLNFWRPTSISRVRVAIN